MYETSWPLYCGRAVVGAPQRCRSPTSCGRAGSRRRTKRLHCIRSAQRRRELRRRLADPSDASGRRRVVCPRAALLTVLGSDVGLHAADDIVVLRVNVVVGRCRRCVLRVRNQQLLHLVGVAVGFVAPENQVHFRFGQDGAVAVDERMRCCGWTRFALARRHVMRRCVADSAVVDPAAVSSGLLLKGHRRAGCWG